MTTAIADHETPMGRLERVRALRAAAADAERGILVEATEWADAHPALDPDESAWDGDSPLPAMVWTAVPEFAAALGMTTQAGQSFIEQALEARHRLPRCWQAMRAGKAPAWRIRRIASRTLGYPDDVADYVDRRVSRIAGKVGLRKLDTVIDEAMIRLYPAEREADLLERLDRRFVKLFDQITHNGIAEMHIRGDLADLFGFDKAVSLIAHRLGQLGDPDTLDVRKSKAVGILADPEAALALLTGTTPETTTPETAATTDPDPAAPGDAPTEDELAGDPLEDPADPAPDIDPEPLTPEPPADDYTPAEDAPTDPAPAPDPEPLTGPVSGPAPVRPKREIVLHVHVSEAAVRGFDPVGRLERGDQPITEQLIRRWCGRTDTHLSVRPIRDLDQHQAVDNYRPSEGLKEQVEEATLTCVFPWCNRPARNCDKDHNLPHDQGGATCSCNLAPLCRRHHRLKTETPWRYEILDLGTYLWTSPHGMQYLRDHEGTTDVTPAKDRADPTTTDPSPPWTGCWYDNNAA